MVHPIKDDTNRKMTRGIVEVMTIKVKQQQPTLTTVKPTQVTQC